jgi:hypothetical protein
VQQLVPAKKEEKSIKPVGQQPNLKPPAGGSTKPPKSTVKE